MESEEKIIQSFRELGIRRTAAMAYLTLLRIGPSTATKISKSSEIPQPRTYDIMNYLQQRGFIVVQKIGRRKIYQASKPEFALDQLMNHLRSKETFLRGSLKNLRNTEPSLSEIWLIKGNDNIVAKIREIVEKSKIELLLAISLNLLNRQLMASLCDAAGRGVSISIVLYCDSDIPKKELNALRKWASIRKKRIFYTTVAMADYKFVLILSHIKENFMGVKYATYAEDPGLLHIMDYHYYHMLWLPSEIISEEAKARSFTHIWRAIEILKVLMEEGKVVQAIIKGREVKTGKNVLVEGTVCGTTVIHSTQDKIYPKPVYSITLRDADGKQIQIGGRGAVVEDVEALHISLVVQN